MSKQSGLNVNSSIKSGGVWGGAHNSSSLKVKSGIKAGGPTMINQNSSPWA